MIYYLFDMNKNDENKNKDILIEETYLLYLYSFQKIIKTQELNF